MQKRDDGALTALRASDLVQQLEALISRHGDLPVLMWDDSDIREVGAYDADGDTNSTRVVIILHGQR